jgi:hypothetical protein
MDYSITDIAERLGIHTSVVENYEEEWKAQQDDQEEDFITESFTDFLCRTFAECAFLCDAMSGSNAMECLEAYDETYGNIEGILTDD